MAFFAIVVVVVFVIVVLVIVVFVWHCGLVCSKYVLLRSPQIV